MRFALIALLGVVSVQSHKLSHDSIWDDMIGGVDESSYNKETPKEYKEAEKPKVDRKAILAKKRKAEEARK